MNNGITEMVKGFKKQEKLEKLKRYFPGISCGNSRCEEIMADACNIAEMLSVKLASSRRSALTV